jgi:tetratricopeptide (TPR) repeat protein
VASRRGIGRAPHALRGSRAALRLAVLWTVTLHAPVHASAQATAAKSTAKSHDAADQRDLADARARFEAGARAYARGELVEALQHFEAAQAIAPSDELCFDIARTLERMGEPERAIAMYERYLAAAAPSAAQRQEIDARIVELKRHQARLAQQAIKGAPSGDALKAEARTFFGRGVKLFRRGQYAAARSAFDAALQFADVPELHFNLALVAERLRQPADALAHYRAYLKASADVADRADVERRIAELRARH